MSEVDPSFWSGRRVLVTGHTGFKGAWLTLWLARMGASVTGLGQAVAPQESLFGLARVGEDCESVDCDIRDVEQVAEVVRTSRPEVVMHLAAQPLVRRSYREPLATWAINVMGTANVLDAVRQAGGVEAVVCVTSDKCYENRDLERGYTEDDPLGGHDPYSSSKAAAELVAAAYRRSYFEDGARIGTGRAGNVIGGGDFGEDRLVSDLMRDAVAGRVTPIRNPAAVRPWQHVLNAISGYVVLAQSMAASREFASAWNFGPDPGDAKPVRWIADRLVELWPERVAWEADGGEHPHEARYLSLDSTKAHTELGWAPRWDLDRTLEAIVEWHRGHAEGADLRELTLDQIEAFAATRAVRS